LSDLKNVPSETFDCVETIVPVGAAVPDVCGEKVQSVMRRVKVNTKNNKHFLKFLSEFMLLY